MRSSHARLMVLGTAALALGALACTHDLGTAPQAASGPSYAKGGSSGKVRSYHGSKTTFDIDHDRASVRDRRTGREVQLERATLDQVEKSYDRIVAMQSTLDRLRRDPAFGKAMLKAAKSDRQVRLRINPEQSPGGVSSGGPSAVVSAGTVQVAAAASGPCTELELQIYTGTQELNETTAAYDAMMNDLMLLGWGFDGSGVYGFDPIRYVAQLASWAVRSDLLAYRISAIRTVLGYLAMQYELAGCWYQGTGGSEPPQPEPEQCRYETGRIEVLVNGVWVPAWDGKIRVCGQDEE